MENLTMTGASTGIERLEMLVFRILSIKKIVLAAIFALVAVTSSEANANLQLTTSVISQKFCSDGRLGFTLRFKFISGGRESVVFDKRSSIVPRFTVSRNAQEAAAGKHKIIVEYLIGIDGPLLTLNPLPDESQFVILKSRESHIEDHPFSIPADDKKLTAGNYVLQLSVLTWHYPQASNIEWREKWKHRGYLWTDSLMSMPMTFTIAKQHPIEKYSYLK